MFKSLFGGGNRGGPPDQRTLEKWFGYGDVRAVQRALQSFSASFLKGIDAERLVESSASPADLQGDGAEFIKGKVLKLMMGPAPGHRDMPLNASQASVAQKVYDSLRSTRSGDSYATGLSAGLLNAATAWCAGQHEHAKLVADHIVNDLAPDAGEAYRIRAFANISLGRYRDAVADLKRAFASVPQPKGVAEPLAAIEPLLGAS